MKYILLISLLLFLIQCNRSTLDLNYALKYSGNNRGELKKVLDYYSTNQKDSLKYKAAVFLIKNMPGQISPVDKELYAFYDELIKVHYTEKDKYPNLVARINEASTLNQDYSRRISYREDIKEITADFLINNIELSFDLWENKPWCQHLSFDDFCEYILPYKILNRQPIDYWKDSLDNKFDLSENLFKHSGPYNNSSYLAAKSLSMDLRTNTKTVHWEKSWIQVLSPIYLQHLLPGTCDGYTLMTAAAMRSKGIPVGIDYTPQWPFRHQGHSWNTLLMTNAKILPFAGIEHIPGMLDKIGDKMGKVFRNTYAINDELYVINKSGQQIPLSFKDLFFKDVTSEYIVTTDVEIPFFKGIKCKDNYLWISHFDISGWNPIHYGYNKNNSGHFKNMGRNCLYLASSYDNNGVKPINYPFTISFQGNVEYFQPDIENRILMKINRKYFRNTRTYTAGKNTKGGTFQASNDSDFTIYTLIDSIVVWPENTSIEIQDSTKYRYWRYRAPENRFCDIAELMFFDENGVEIQGDIIISDSLKSSWFKASLETIKQYPFDKNALTTYTGSSLGSSIGMDFSKPVRLSRIIYVPRTDDNNVNIGETYELFYYDLKGWVSLGVKVADDIFLEYDNVPANALYWLRNHTKGVEERPFSYENGKQVFW